MKNPSKSSMHIIQPIARFLSSNLKVSMNLTWDMGLDGWKQMKGATSSIIAHIEDKVVDCPLVASGHA